MLVYTTQDIPAGNGPAVWHAHFVIYRVAISPENLDAEAATHTQALIGLLGVVEQRFADLVEKPRRREERLR